MGKLPRDPDRSPHPTRRTDRVPRANGSPDCRGHQ
jgi:hypothetical protein